MKSIAIGYNEKEYEANEALWYKLRKELDSVEILPCTGDCCRKCRWFKAGEWKGGELDAWYEDNSYYSEPRCKLLNRKTDSANICKKFNAIQ